MYFNKHNIKWIALLGILFFTSYGAVNHLTAYLDTIRPIQSFVWDWEKYIPFLPIFIYPYMSIDLLYALAFFIIPKNRYTDSDYKKIINGLGYALLFNQLFSIISFLSFPLKFSFDKPDIPEEYQLLFNTLLNFDLPYNQTPSLHISILVILCVFYNQHIYNKILKSCLNFLFIAIFFSVIFTYQHHFIDVLMGLFLGVSLVLMFNFDPKHYSTFPKYQKIYKNKVYKIYLGIIAFFTLILFIIPIMNNIYLINFQFNPTVYIICWILFLSFLTSFKIMFYGSNFKIRNEQNFFTHIFIAINSLYIFVRKLFIYPFHYYKEPIEINSNLYISNYLALKNKELPPNSIVINLAWEINHRSRKNRIISYPLIDLIYPNQEQLKEITREIQHYLKSGKTVYIHCALGMFRTIIVTVYYLNRYQNKDLNEIFEILKHSELHPKIKNYIAQRKDKIINLIADY